MQRELVFSLVDLGADPKPETPAACCAWSQPATRNSPTLFRAESRSESGVDAEVSVVFGTCFGMQTE